MIEVQVAAVMHAGQPYVCAGKLWLLAKVLVGYLLFRSRTDVLVSRSADCVLLAKAFCHLFGSGCCIGNPALAPVKDY